MPGAVRHASSNGGTRTAAAAAATAAAASSDFEHFFGRSRRSRSSYFGRGTCIRPKRAIY